MPEQRVATPHDCPDCGVEVGGAHEEGCDVAVCLWTGGQRLQCCGGLAAECCGALADAGKPLLAVELAHYLDLDDAAHDCGEEVWTGVWPGEDDAARLGWFTYWGPDFGETGWVPCGPEHPGARPDLNRLNPAHATWNREARRWEAKEPTMNERGA